LIIRCFGKKYGSISPIDPGDTQVGNLSPAGLIEYYVYDLDFNKLDKNFIHDLFENPESSIASQKGIMEWNACENKSIVIQS